MRRYKEFVKRFIECPNTRRISRIRAMEMVARDLPKMLSDNKIRNGRAVSWPHNS